MIYTGLAGHCSNVNQYTHVRLQHRRKRIEKPAMRVDLLLIFLFHAEQDLARYNAFIRVTKLNCTRARVRAERERGGVLENVRGDFLPIDAVLHVPSRLIHTKQGEAVKHAGVDFFAAVCNDADNHFLPSVLTPCSRVLACAEVGNVLHHSVDCATEENFVLLLCTVSDEIVEHTSVDYSRYTL